MKNPTLDHLILAGLLLLAFLQAVDWIIPTP
jgi:hypothetical protein